MGINTTVLVLNDALHLIERDKEFGEHLAAAVRDVSAHGRPSERPHYYAPGAVVVESHHADDFRPVLIGGNLGKPLDLALGAPGGITSHGQVTPRFAPWRRLSGTTGPRLETQRTDTDTCC